MVLKGKIGWVILGLFFAGVITASMLPDNPFKLILLGGYICVGIWMLLIIKEKNDTNNRLV